MKNLLILVAIIFTISVNAQTSEELEMFNAVNQLRSNPKSFIPHVEAYIKKLESFIGKSLIDVKLGSNVIITKNTKTIENKETLDSLISETKQLIEFLKSQKSTSSLEFNKKLYTTSKKFVNYLDSTKKIGHTGPDNQTLSDRILGLDLGLNLGENCVVNKDNTSITETIIIWLVDFKVKDKGHRKNLLNEKFVLTATAKSGNYWVQDFIGTH